jgi:hypothetical protein
MLRVVVAVALAVALLGVAMPAVDSARVDHADARVATALDRLAATAERLRARNDPSPPGTAGARRMITLHLPGPSWASARLETLSVPATTAGRGPSGRGTVTWRVEGGGRRTRVLSAPVVGPDGGLTVRGGGSRQLVVELVREGGRAVVRIRRPEFKSDAGTSSGHDAPGNGTRRRARG